MGMRVGIDLGTTFSAVARIDPVSGKPVVIKNSFGQAITPSVLCFERNGNVLFGEDAKSLQLAGDLNTAAFFKRSMGKDLFSVDFFGKSYNATELSAILLRKLKEEAEAQTGESIDGAVITVPAYFAHKEREATLEAGKRAGLNVLAIINEPTAAAFAYGLNERDTEQTVMIYDLGGGTFDVTLARINRSEIRILGSDGDHELGGKDWDDCIARYLAEHFEEKYGVDISEDPEAASALLVTAENVKKQLTSRDRVTVPIACRGVRGSVEITEETFEAISEFLLGITKEVTERLLASVNVSWNQVDGVILVGGSTRMRMISNYVYEMCGKRPLGGVNVDEAVALGAAIRANITETGAALPSMGALPGGRKTAMPTIRGAKAVTDVTAHSLGMISISQDGESYMNSIIIGKNTAIPAADRKPYKMKTRTRDNELEVYVLQGEHRRPLDNTIINKYVITGIEKIGRGAESVIEVTYRYTANGVIEVSAVQTETKKTLPIRIEPVPEDMSWTDLPPREHLKMTGGGLPDVYVLLAIDLSGSMYGKPMKKAAEAMDEFVQKMNPKNTQIGLIAFADQVKLTQEFSYDYEAVRKSIQDIKRVNVGGGNDAEPFTLALREIRKAADEDSVRYIVVLTDGQWYEPDDAIRAAKACHADGIEVMALGFGTADRKFLKKIASTDEFATMTDLSKLESSFSKIAQEIGEKSSKIVL